MSQIKLLPSFLRALCACVFVSPFAQAEELACGRPFIDHSIGHGSAGFVEAKHLTVAGVTSGKSSLNDVRARFGPAKPFHLTNEEESQVGVCYLDTSGKFAVVFAAGMPGSWKTINSIFIGSANDFTANGAECAISLGVTPIATKSELRLGLTRHEICDILKMKCSPSKKSTNQVVFESSNDSTGLITTSAVFLRFYGGKLCWLEIYQGASE